VAVDARHVVGLPDGVKLAAGALAEPMAVGLHALRMAGLRGGEHVVILGAGTTALALVYWARRLGAGRIVVASRSEHRREVAERMGADEVVPFDTLDVGAPDIVAEAVGRPGMLEKAVSLARPRGTVLSVGICFTPDTLTPVACSVKELRLLFPLTYTHAEYAETVRAFAGGHVRPEIMVGEVIGLDALPARLQALRDGARTLKVHVDPGAV
jgi:threonine dehydrogenase-like Zn-dependent dehydrogenase